MRNDSENLQRDRMELRASANADQFCRMASRMSRETCLL